MKILIPLFSLLLFCSCKQTESKSAPKKGLSIAQKIANAHGFQNWNKVKTFHFTFGGNIDDPDSGHAWVWNPKTSDIQLTRNGEIIEYNRSNMDSVALKADRAFINDKFWALIPFQLVLDEGITISEVEKNISPVKQEQLNKITVLYSNEGGYTPGDAYDIYFDDNYMIREWSYRKANAPEPSLSNTFENYQEFNSIKIAQEHKKEEGDWNLLVRNIKVVFDQ